MNIRTRLEQIATTRFFSDFCNLSKEEQYICVASFINEKAAAKRKETREKVKKQQLKEVYYFSMEFLLGRLLVNNIENMGLYEEVNEALREYGLSIKDLECEEVDAGLGNGGLGRLAACFMDSIASLNYPGYGVTLRYRNGFFRQTFDSNEQVELPDYWLQNNQAWEKQMAKDACTISFYGELKTVIEDDKEVRKLVNSTNIVAMPYDMPIVGEGGKTVNVLRMYDVCPLPEGVQKEDYENNTFEIIKNLYPDDSTVEGKELRLKQQYVFVSAGLQNIIKKHLTNYNSLDNIMNHVIIQINDTHPVLIVPEMMRILMDNHNYSFSKAWSITTKSVAYTNHTILKEALEEWNVTLVKNLLPRVFEIIEQIDENFKKELRSLNYSEEQVSEMKIIGDNRVRMAYLAIVSSFRVNGVAALHTQIIKEHLLKDWNHLYPNKIINKTNGITQRRWLDYSNPKLRQLLETYATDKDRKNPIKWFNQFLQYSNDKNFLNELENIKQENKNNLVSYIKENEGIDIDPHSIFDIQIKRMHAYKRQLLNVLHIIYLYNRLKKDPVFYNKFHPQTFIFGAKAAPSYVLAKNIIKLVKLLEEIIKKDPEVNIKLNVVMVTNYNVSYAEKLIPAADISEQISTAGYEASGTGNMKFMMNGAITLGTMDGANVEIYDLVGEDNIVIFGLLKDEVKEIHENNCYDAKKFIKGNGELEEIIGWIEARNTAGEFQPIIDNLFKENDYYLVLKEFAAYKTAHEKLNHMYRDKENWYQKTLVNIAHSGFFSSDRTIEEYVKEIWQLQKIE